MDLLEWYNTHQSTDRLKKLNEESSNTINSYNDRINKGEWLSAEDLEKYNKAISDYIDSSNRFREYNKAYGTTYSDEDEKSWNEIVSSLQNGYASVAQYYSQFGSKIDMDEFNLNWTRDDNPTVESVTARQNAYESNKQRIAELEKSLNFTAGSWLPNFVENIFLSKEDEALRDELEGLRKSNERYEALQMNLDKYYDFDTERFTKSAESGWNRYLSDVEAAKQEEENTPLWVKIISEMGNTADTTLPTAGVTQTITDLRKVDTHKLPNDKWSAEQKQMWGHLYNVDSETAFNYAMEINSRINDEKEEEALKTISEISTSGFWAGVGNTIGAILTAPMAGADFLYDMAQMQAWGRTMSDGSVSPFEYSQAVTGSISTKLNDMGGTLDESIFLIGGKGWGDVYGLGVEIAKSLASKPLGGVGTLISYFGQGAASSFDDAKKRGATDEQALLLGISNGIFEGLTEKYSIETLLSAKTTGNFIKDLLKTMGNQFLAEGQEEGLSSLLSSIADTVIMQDKSNYNALVRQYIGQGMSESEAKEKAFLDSAEGILYDAIAGGISGGVSGGLTATANHIGYNMAASKHGQSLIQKKSVDPLMQLANDMAGVSKTVDKSAQKVSTNASAKNVGRLSFAMQDSINEQNRAEIEKALTEKGLSKKEAKRVSEYLATNKPTAEQTAEIEGNENIKAVVKELLANPNSSINDRSMSLMLARLGKVYKSSTIASDKAKIGKEAVIKEVNVKDKVSKDGKTVKKSTGEAVTINKNNPIATIEVEKDDNGNVIKRTVYYNTDKGKVTSDDISYANETEALLYESFVDMSPVVANGIIKNYDGKTPVQTYINGMREGVLVYGMHNFQGIGKDISSKGFFASLSEVDQAIALRIGRSYATTIAKADGNKINIKKAEASANASTETSVKKTAKKGTVTFEEGAKIESHKEDKAERRAEIKAKSRAVDLAKVIAKTTGINIVFYDARNTKYKDGEGANGFFDMDTDTIYLDLRNATDETRTITYTLSHELVHFIKKWSPTKFDTLAKFLMENYASHGVNSSTLLANKMAKNNNDADRAYEEMIADACETMLLDSNAVVKLMELRKADLELFEKIKLHILKILNGIRDMYKSLGYQANTEEGKALLAMTDVLEQMYTLFEDAAVEAVENFQAVESLADLEPNTDVLQVEGTVKHSYKSLAQAAGFEAIEDENGNRSFIRDGKAVSKVTIEDIENSPIGAFINYSLDKKDITKEQADEQKKLFADICTLACQTNDFSMTMQFVGSEVFTAMKANADKQYGTTYDMPSICTKTQAVIDAMSARMVKLGRGLTTEEITAIYNEVNHAGNPVPCPECYVFSRWIGIGGLLNNIKQYQDYYGKMSVSEVAEAYKKMRTEIETAAAKMEISFGKAKGALVKKYTSEYNKLTDKIAKQENQGEKVKEADRKKLAELESMQNTVKAMTWIENVYFADSSLTKVNKNFKVPDDVLFDLNMGEKFATQYKEAWAFRTTQGAGYGKAITPYAEVTLGEGILVTNNTSNAIKGKQNGTLNNYFLQQRGQMNAEARKALDRARLKQKIQAFLGGQRFQSTSDARYENASDYLLAALEMQAMHGKVQVYTKVDGAVPAFEAWGFSSNQSLMPKGGGLDENGNVKDTSVGGMNPKVAFANRNKHEHAGTITIGVNDNHIRALFALINRDFIIPYHASGGKADVVAEFRRIQEGLEEKGEMVRSTDYSRTQSDKVLSDEVLRWLGKTDAEIEQIHKVREARIAILTGGKVNMDVVRGNRFLSALYDKFHGGEWDGVKLAKSKVESQIFPNEFWDETVTYDESGQITLDYLEYCDDLGFLHRFSGLVPSNGMLVPIKGYDENGKKVPLTDLAFKYEDGKRTNKVEDFYWKVLTDRRMYGHNGQYLRQQTVSLNSTTEDTVTTFAKNNDGRQYNKELSLATANKVSSETWGNIVEEVGAENIPEATEQYTDVENTTRIKKQKKETSDNTYESIGKELMYYEEGDLAPDLTLVETINDRTGNKEITIKHHGQKPKNYVPKKIAYCYKLFEQHPDGTLHALFAGASNAVPLNEWRYAQGFPRNDAGVKGMNLRERYGWHLSAGLPSAPHLMSSKYFERGYPSKNSYGHPKGSKRVWVRMAYDASTDFNSIADSTGRENDIYGLIPFGGYYAFKENNQSEWVISSAVKIDKILDEKERQQILKDAGFDEYEAWRLKFQATPEEKAARELAAKERQKAKARAKKLGIDSELTESTKAMRETIKSRIIDNPELKSNIKKQAKENTERILMGSLFSGGGTLEAGLTYQMLDKQFGVEYDGRIASVYADNHGDHIQVGRVEDFDISKYDDIFYLHASPVCHNFSTAKHGAKELQQDIDSARATAMHLETAKPQVFTVENAPGYRKSESLKVITNKLTELGYKWDVDVYNSADYGSATSRNRVILRAVKEGELPPKPIKQERTNSWDKVTRDLWNTLPKSNLRPSFISAIENTPKLPILDANGKVNVNKPLLILTTTNAHTVTFCWEGEICPTLTTKCGEAKLVMPDGNIYAVTPEFMGRIQGLPDDYKYPKEKTRAFTIIGNGIPTHLTKAVVGGVLDSAYEQTHEGRVLYQKKDNPSTYAPTFYSHMDRVVDGIKTDKIGATSLIPYLKGKGVKNDEIKWSGIEAFLEGKKSVTKAELHEFLAGSQLRIEEEMGSKPWVLEKDGDDYIVKDKDGRVLETWEYTEAPDDPDMKGWYNFEVGEIVTSVEEIKKWANEDYGDGNTRWDKYTLEGGENYRELVFKMPKSSYSNDAMRVHWGGEAEGVLAHARIQDMTTADGRKMLFIEEIQSDWHNEGAKDGYQDAETENEIERLRKEADIAFFELEDYSTELTGTAGEYKAVAKTQKGRELLRNYYKARDALKDAENAYVKKVPDAPFRDTYHEYVLKRLLRMAAEEGYDSIGWTPAYIQSERWSEDYAEAYRIEYDQDMPSFLKKYGKKWGATVGKAEVTVAEHSVNGEHYDAENIEVWSMDITDSMKDSVLYEGQVKFQKKEVSNRTLLANALESTIDSSTQAGKNELEKLKEYKSKVAMLETEEEHLAEVKSQIDEIMYKKSLSIGKEKLSVKEFEHRAKELAEKQGLSADNVTFKLDRENNKYIAYVGNKELLSADKTFRSKEDTEKLKALNEDKTITSNKINTLDRQLLKYEAMKPIKDVLAREKELVRKRTEEKGREALEAYKEKMLKVQKEQIGQARELRSKAIARVKESRDKQEARAKLTKLVLDTVKWITHPGKTDVRCPDMLKAPYQEFLESINLDSKRALNGGEATHNDLRVASAMQSLALVVEKIRATQANGEGDASGFLDIPGDFVAVLRTMAEDIKKMMVGGDFVVNKMTATEIKQITKLVRTLNHAIKEMNTTHANLRFANAAALGDSSVNFLDSMGKAKSTNSVKDFINWDNALPFYAFKKFGEAGESVFEELMDAQDKMAFLAQTILDFTSKTWTDKEADEWGKDTHTIELSDDKTLTLTSADAMGIYCLSRRDNGQGLNHLLGGGVRVIGLTKGATKAQDSRSTLTLSDIHTIINSLSKRQIEVAEAIQKFMSTVCSEWGNEISMKRFLTKDFTEKLYYPIESNNENLNTELPEASQSDLYRLLNISATKPLTQNANNQIVIRNIFDVFTNHAADMARLNAYGMALLDYMKWVNYRERIEKDNGQIETRGVRQSMNTAYGDKAIRYVLNLIKDINGRAGDVGSHPWLSKMARMAKTASVAGNVRVMLLQVTAYPRAAMVLPVDSLAKGLMKIPQIEKTKKYCGIALWKSFGFFDTNIARSIEDQIKGTKNIRAKLIELSMKGAEYADAITWGALWNACEYEVAKTTKNKVGSEAFYYEVGKKLRDVVYATQVVDSVLTRSQLMRSKDGLTQMATAYMSEPTLTANILMDAGFQFAKAKRLGLPTKDAWNHLGRTIGVYTSVAVFTTLIESLADAFRDEDDEEFVEKFAEALLPNLISNVVPFNKLPIIADISDAIQSLITGDKYFTTELMSSQWITQTIYAINAWKSVLSGKNTPTTVYDALFKSLKAISFMTGLPISNAMRDLVALWNNIIGAIDEDLKID